MNLTWLKKIAVKFEIGRIDAFRFPAKEQAKFLSHFPEPKDEIERSYFQYCCQMKLYGAFYHGLLNLAALPFSLLLLFKYKKVQLEPEDAKKCVFIRYDLPENVVPHSLRERYPEMHAVSKAENCLKKEDIDFLKTIFKRYPFSWLFWMKNIIKVSQFSAVMCRFSPEAIITCEEYSFTSSAITQYCRDHKVRRINVMHGEKLFFIRDSFVSFDEFYVWSQEYVDLFGRLRAAKDQFCVEVPPSLLFEKRDVEKTVDYTYYLQDQSGDELARIVRTMKQLVATGKKVVFRPHPRFTPLEELNRLCDGSGIEIEVNREISIEESVLRTRNVISVFSTVLQQAYYNNVAVVIDDVSNPEMIGKLQEIGFVMLQTPHKKLSELSAEKLY